MGENKDWKLGVVSESAQRKGLFDMSPSCGYYALWWSNSHLRALTAPPLTKVTTGWSGSSAQSVQTSVQHLLLFLPVSCR